MLLATAALVLKLELIRYSLTGTHYRYRQYLDETPIAGAEVNVTVRPDGTREEDRVLSGGQAPPPVRTGEAPVLHLVNVNGVARWARRTVTDRIARYVDVETGETIRVEPLFAGAKPARVFVANPVETLNDPSLQDHNNSATAVPDAAYTTVDLDDVNPSGPLGGPYVQITDLQPPAIAPADSSQPLLFDRSQTGFEDVNAYFQIDRSQRYLQSLGYRGERSIAAYPVQVDTHAANSTDTSFFIPSAVTGQGFLIFGDGGVDDAEDANLVVHEYAHAIHEWIVPGTFLGAFASEGRAISEGFADYWGFSASYAETLRSGRDPFCFADWDARCWEDASSENCGYPVGADCLRRLDSTRTIADFDTNDAHGTEYVNGEIWSSALREIFVALTQRYGVEAGRRTADTIAVESVFGAPPNPGFAGIARKMIAADRYLDSGANADVICAAMMHRGILRDCAVLPRGELTVFQSRERGVAIPDNDANGVTLKTFVTGSGTIERLYVRVDIRHPFRGDLQITLIAPDGTQTILQNTTPDRVPDVHATYGRDAVPFESLDVFRGRSTTGEWKLRVADLRPRDVGTVMSWSLVVQFAGDSPAAQRPGGAPRQFIPVAGRVPGANGTFFTSDVRLLNRGSRDTTATVIFTPSGADGSSEFAAVKIDVAAGQVAGLIDIVGETFGTAGTGQLEIDGDVLASSRTYTRNNSGGTLGELIPPEQGSRAAILIRLYNTAELRSNIGFAETGGNAGTVHVSLRDALTGVEVQTTDYTVAPYSHIQVPASAATAMIAFIDSTTDVAAYGSVIDNATGDAMFVAPHNGEVRLGLAPAINALGAFGTQWTTDVWMSELAFGNGAETLTYTDTATLRPASAFIQWQRQTQLKDVVRLTFNAQGTRGMVSTTVGGSVVKDAVIANGGYRQSVRFLTPVATTQDVPYIENSTGFRTNVGLMSDVAAVARVTLYDAAGQELESGTHTLAPLQLDQFAIQPRVVDGRIRVEVLSGRVAAYASVVDNLTGDASFVPAR